MSDAVLTITRTSGLLASVLEPQESVLFPSSLDSDDPMVLDLIAARTTQGKTTQVRIPNWRGPFSRVAVPGTDNSMRLDRTLVDTSFAIALVNLEIVGHSGPFVLDLAARYLSPVDRAKLLMSPGRITTLARINLVRPFDSVIIGKQIGAGTIWIETQDLIAAELAALALSEDSLPSDRRHLSPWEDELIQRATELSLGARYPGDIRLKCDTSAAESDVKAVIEALYLRIGIDISTISAQYWQIT